MERFYEAEVREEHGEHYLLGIDRTTGLMAAMVLCRNAEPDQATQLKHGMEGFMSPKPELWTAMDS